MVLTRRDARILIVQTLFENDFYQKNPTDEGFMRTFNAIAKEHNPEFIDNPFAKKVLEGIASKYEEINQIIEQAATDWPLEKIGSVDRNILRLGVFELLFGKELEVPGRVALNEAIEITKAFLDDSARKFINGVLGAVYNEVKDPNEDDVPPAKKMEKRKSVGGVIFKKEESEEPKFAFVHDVFGKWTLSKGSLENGESVDDGFKRVVREEIGINVEALEKIGSNSYVAHLPEGAVCKEVVYLLGKTNDKVLNLKETGGLDDAQWFSCDEAKNLTFYPDLKQIILDGMHKAEEEYASKT